MSTRLADKESMPPFNTRHTRWSAYLAYTYTDATFQSGFVEAAGSNPAADADGNITINPGNRLYPAFQRTRAVFGATLRVTDPMDDRWCS